MKVNPRPQAIIVIFGAAVRPNGQPTPTLRHRVEAALRFGATRTGHLFIPTGARGRHGDAEAVVMARLLAEGGIQPDAIIEETTGTDTLSSARAVARIIRALPPAPVYACSSAYHLPRCLLLLRLAGIRARPCPPPPLPAATAFGRRWFWRLREVPAVPYDTALMLWHRLWGRV